MPLLTISNNEARLYVAKVHNLDVSQVTIEPSPTCPAQFQYDYDGELNLMRNFNQAVANREKLQAIKWLREMTGSGLKEAKDFVDALWVKKGI